MINRDDKGKIHISVGYSLWIIDKLIRENGKVTFPLFKEFCINKSREEKIIKETESIDDSICQYAFDEGIKRLKYLLVINKRNVLEEKWDSTKKTFYQYKEKSGYRIFPETKYSYKDYNKIPPCKIDETDCVKFIDKLLSSGKIYSTFALYSELEKEYCWVKNFVDDKGIENNKAELYRKCYSEVLKQCLKHIEEYLIVKDIGELFVRTRCLEYQKQYDYHYAVAGITVLNEKGELSELTRYDRFKIYANNCVEAEINDIKRKKRRQMEKGNSTDTEIESIMDDNFYISDIESITDKIKAIADNIKEKQIISYLKDKLSTISNICVSKIKGWQGKYSFLMNEVQKALDANRFKPLAYADLLATYAQLLGKYGYPLETEQVIKDKWFDTICNFYNEMISICIDEEHPSKERQARYLIKYANFLRKENKYDKLEEKYSEAISIYEQIIKEKESIELKQDYAYALRSQSKFYSDYDRISEAIEDLEKSLEYIDKSAPNSITDTRLQLAMRYAEYGDNEKAREVLNKALEDYLKMAKYNQNYYANIANVYIKLLRNISPSSLKKFIEREVEPKYETQCKYYLALYEKLRDKKLNTNDNIYAHALTSLALYYCDTGQRGNAVNICKKALEVHISIRNNGGHYNINIINHHFYLGRALSLPAIECNKEQLYESVDKIQVALDFYSEINDEMVKSGQCVPLVKKGLADTYLALAETYDYLGNIDDARVKYQKAIELYSDLDKNIEAKDKYKELLKKANDLLQLLDMSN